MEAAAIQKLIDLTLQGMPQLEGADRPLAVLPETCKLTSLELYQNAPYRMRGTYRTSTVEQFAHYCEEWQTEETRIFVDPASMTAVARFDHGDADTAGWGDHLATLTLEKTPAFAALCGMTKAPVTQQALIDYFLDWLPQLSFSAAEASDWDPMPEQRAIQAIRKLKIEAGSVSEHTQGDLARERSLLEQVAVTSKPPAALRLHCAPYRGLQERDIVVRLAYKPEQPPKISLRILQLEALEDALADEFLGQLKDADHGPGICAGMHIGKFESRQR
jgi:uncharacterized protein YfdQ (DUF2303 family)